MLIILLWLYLSYFFFPIFLVLNLQNYSFNLRKKTVIHFFNNLQKTEKPNHWPPNFILKSKTYKNVNILLKLLVIFDFIWKKTVRSFKSDRICFYLLLRVFRIFFLFYLNSFFLVLVNIEMTSFEYKTNS